MDFDTAEGQKIRVVPIKGLEYPWSMAFLPDGAMLVTERTGRLRIIRNFLQLRIVVIAGSIHGSNSVVPARTGRRISSINLIVNAWRRDHAAWI